MIHVTCAACGKAFSARDGLAGQRGKCPGCGAVLVVPGSPAPAAGGSAAANAPAATPDSPPAAPRLAARGGSAAARRHAGTQRKTRSAGARAGIAAGALAVVAGLAFAVVQMAERDPGAEFFSRADTAFSAGRLDEARALFSQVPATSGLYAQAQERLADVAAQAAVRSDLDTRQAADSLFRLIEALEQGTIEREGPTGKRYRPAARYLLKRCREFVQRFPDDPRSATLKQYDWKYAQVASLSTPPTEQDVEVEIDFRASTTAARFAEAVAAIDEFAALPGSDADAVRRLRDRVQKHSLAYWATVLDRLQRGGDLEPGSENWQRVANQVQGYVDAVQGVPGIQPAAEAQALLARALRGGG